MRSLIACLSFWLCLAVASAGPGDALDYRLGPGDLIEVQVFGIDDFEHTLRINSSGTIRVPLVGLLQVAGLTPAEVEQLLAARLGRDLIRNPQVSVFVQQYRSQTIFVLGAVKNPGQFEMTRPMTLVDALSLAGGLDLERAGDNALLQRRASPDVIARSGGVTSTVTEVDLEELLELGGTGLNLAVQDGDIVSVPERTQRLFYVIGEVEKPGVYEMPVRQEFFLTQALAWAGGARRTADIDKATLIRYQGEERLHLPVDFKQILKGQAADMKLQTRDVLFVPGSTIKTIGYGLLDVIPATISGAIIWGALRR